MASLILKGSSRSALSSVVGSLRIVTSSRIYSSVAADSDVVSAAPDVSLQKAQIWNGGVSSMFSTIPVTDIFKGKKVANFGLPGALTGVCSQQDVPSNKNDIDKFKAKGIDSVVFAAVSNPHVVNARPEKLGAKDAVEFNGDSDGSLRQKDLSQTSNYCLSPVLSSVQRVSSFIYGYSTIYLAWKKKIEMIIQNFTPKEDGKIKALNVEEAPSNMKVSVADVILGFSVSFAVDSSMYKTCFCG